MKSVTTNMARGTYSKRVRSVGWVYVGLMNPNTIATANLFTFFNEWQRAIGVHDQVLAHPFNHWGLDKPLLLNKGINPGRAPRLETSKLLLGDDGHKDIGIALAG